MRVRCLTCDTDDIPPTRGLRYPNGAILDHDTTIYDHCQIWHPNEFVTIESMTHDSAVIRATGELFESREL